MAEVKILVEGYTSKNNNKSRTCPTITLVRDRNVVMVVDPGTVEEQEILVEKLRENGLTTDDVNFVCITHAHMDHYRNVGMFPNAKTFGCFGLWHGDKFEKLNENLTKNIKIMKTPGHSDDSITLLVKTKIGKVAICGDVFWKENFPEKDIYANDMKRLIESRKKVLRIADFIIPGHGKMFSTKR